MMLLWTPTFHISQALPHNVSLDVTVADRFYLKPMFAMADRYKRFYVLALQLGHVRCFEATRHSIAELELEDMPLKLEDAVSTDAQQALQVHSAGGSPADPGGPKGPLYHGQGGGKDNIDAKIRHFFRTVDEKLAAKFVSAPGPVVLVGAPHLVPIFRDANSKLSLTPDDVMKNPEGMSDREIHQVAWPCAQSYIEAGKRAAAHRARELEGSTLVSHDLAEIVVAASDGRLESLFIPTGEAEWGRFDDEARTVRRFRDQRPQCDDLYDVAAACAHLRGADVFVVPPEEVPGKRATVTAIFRY